ncbi:MAG: RnfABCDGE type electron transport complex subunit G [Oscillospiraceae bacterium]|nr:RnfABCDGE type electron transport complex subunit G [Oscillospiraceae bacterium]MBQ6402684.1 RnfABCDGE type electron transport complex subunit G [Oscillospiraceae bacterium]
MTETKQSGGGQILKLALVLLAVAAVIALVLGVVNEITRGPIEQYLNGKRDAAYAMVMPGEGNTYEEIEAGTYANDPSNSITKLCTAKDASGNDIGYVAETTFSGAQGMITMVIGLDNDLTCTGIGVTEHSETSGLGAKAADPTDPFPQSMVGLTDGAKLSKDGGSVSAISGATLTSRAVVTEIQTVIDAVKSL